jgi:hypothetical protein
MIANQERRAAASLDLTRFYDPRMLEQAFVDGPKIAITPLENSLRTELRSDLAEAARRLGEQASIVALTLKAIATFLNQGPVIIRPPLALCRALANTDIPLTVGDYRQPFPALGVELPREITGHAYPALTMVWHAHPRGLVVLTNSRKTPYTFHLVLMDGALGEPPTIEGQLRRCQPVNPNEQDEALLVHAPRIALNLGLLATFKDYDLGDLPHKVKRNRTHRDTRVRHLAQRHAQILGIRDLDLFLQWKKPSPNTEPSAVEGRTQPAHFRRGHWKRIACGSEHKDHRLGWIEPYWTGDRSSGDRNMALTILS